MDIVLKFMEQYGFLIISIGLVGMVFLIFLEAHLRIKRENKDKYENNKE